MKAEHGGCKYNRRPPHEHQYVRGLCRRCGARDEAMVDETPWLELQAAQIEFKKAAEALDVFYGTRGWNDPGIFNLVTGFRTRAEFLRRAEAAWAEKYPE